MNFSPATVLAQSICHLNKCVRELIFILYKASPVASHQSRSQRIIRFIISLLIFLRHLDGLIRMCYSLDILDRLLNKFPSSCPWPGQYLPGSSCSQTPITCQEHACPLIYSCHLVIHKPQYKQRKLKHPNLAFWI